MFTVDTKGDAGLPKKFNKHIKKGLKADEIINARSPVPAVSMRKRPGDKTTNGILPVKRQRTDWVSHKELARLKRVADGEHQNTVQVQDATYDIWDMPVEPQAKDPENFLEEEVKPKAPKTMKKEPLSLLESGKQVPAVLKPKGGYSYNPDLNEYTQRLEEESEKALEAERKRLENIAANRAILTDISATAKKVIPDKKPARPAPRRKRNSEPVTREPTRPTRTSSRLAGRDADSEALKRKLDVETEHEAQRARDKKTRVSGDLNLGDITVDGKRWGGGLDSLKGIVRGAEPGVRTFTEADVKETTDQGLKELRLRIGALSLYEHWVPNGTCSPSVLAAEASQDENGRGRIHGSANHIAQTSKSPPREYMP